MILGELLSTYAENIRSCSPHPCVVLSHNCRIMKYWKRHKSSKTKWKWHKLNAWLIIVCRIWPCSQRFGEASCFYFHCQSCWVEDIGYTLPLPLLWVTTHLSLCLHKPQKILKTGEVCFNFGNETHVSSYVFAMVWIRYLFSSYHPVSPGTGYWCFQATQCSSFAAEMYILTL